MTRSDSKRRVYLSISLVVVIALSNSILTKASESKTDLIIKISNKDLSEADIFFGKISNESEIINPFCVDRDKIIQTMPEIREADRSRKSNHIAKYWILITQAGEKADAQIRDFAKIKNISFLCERKKLLPILKNQEQLSKKSNKELIAQFDLTEAVINHFSSKNKKIEQFGVMPK